MFFLKLKLKSCVIENIEIVRSTVFFIVNLIEVTFKILQDIEEFKLYNYVIKKFKGKK